MAAVSGRGRGGNANIVADLLADRATGDRDVLVNAANADAYTSLMIAAGDGDNTIVGLLVNAGAELDQVSRSQSTALLMAAEAGHEEVVAALVTAGALHPLRHHHHHHHHLLLPYPYTASTTTKQLKPRTT
jgi:ankyrin repeat protein